ncbi:MAG TPA: xanthine dehydrogenase family protein subunit M [Acidimicrobiales bacterium]|nr:xanthine dehydrogenase family protein subunit M [Acidimicrobiales bacterium]
MKPPPFEYHRPASVEGAVALLDDLGDDAKVLAGGQSLVPMMNFRLTSPAHLVDIGGIAELRGVRTGGDGLTIGAMTTHRDVERSAVVADTLPVLAEAVRWVAHPPIRARGTLGGSIAHADPAAELPALALLLGATVSAAGPAGPRTIPSSAFFEGFLTTSLGPGEVVTDVRFPHLPEGAGWGFVEVARRHGDFAMVGAGAVVSRRADTVAELRLVVFGVGGTPLRFTEVEEAAAGEPGTDATWRALAARAVAGLDPPSDLHGTAAYRRHVAGVLLEQVMGRAYEDARP